MSKKPIHNSPYDKKNDKKNDKKIIILKLLSAVLTTSLLGGALFYGCDIKIKKDSNGRYYITGSTYDEKPNCPDRYYNFDDYVTYKIVDGEVIKSFKGENIELLMDKETHEVKWYIFDNFFDGTLRESYELETGELVALYNLGSLGADTKYYKTLCNKSYVFKMVDINNYLEDITFKDSYTIEELKMLEPELKEAILLMNGVKTNGYSRKLVK